MYALIYEFTFKKVFDDKSKEDENCVYQVAAPDVLNAAAELGRTFNKPDYEIHIVSCNGFTPDQLKVLPHG